MSARLASVLMAFALVPIALPAAPAEAPEDETRTETHLGALGGTGAGLWLTNLATWRRDHPIDVASGVTAVDVRLVASDAALGPLAQVDAFFAPSWGVTLLAPDGRALARSTGPLEDQRAELTWDDIDAAGFGAYVARIECGMCGTMTYTLEVTRTFSSAGGKLALDDTRLFVVPGETTSTGLRAHDFGAPGDVEVYADGLPDGWDVDTGPAHDELRVTPPANLVAGSRATFDAVMLVDGAEVDRVVVEAAFTEELARLVAQPNVVVALIDTGINPYHEEFRGPASGTEHPAFYVGGYPEDAMALPLTLDAPDYASAKATDAALWASTKGSTLYYVPGTRIVGMMCYGTATCFPDEGGHGTGTASLVGGTTTGEDPDALIVAVTGDIFGGARWAARQPWIDVVSMSIGPYVHSCLVWTPVCDHAFVGTGNAYVPFSIYGAQRDAYESGKRWFTGSSQGWAVAQYETGLAASGPCPYTFSSAFAGSPWTFAVETYWPWTELPWKTSCTPDMVAQGWDLVAASPSSYTGHNGFGHASGATPQAAGAYARVVHEARRALGSTQEGVSDLTIVAERNVLGGGVLATGSALPKGPLSDGALTVREAERVLLHSLEQVDTAESQARHGADPRWERDRTLVAPGAEYATEGYGILNDGARQLGVDVVWGLAEEPQRPEDDAAYLAQWAARLAFWEPHADAEVWVF